MYIPKLTIIPTIITETKDIRMIILFLSVRNNMYKITIKHEEIQAEYIGTEYVHETLNLWILF